MDAIVTMNQTCFGKPLANVTCWSNFIEDTTWLQAYADLLRISANNTWDNEMVTNWTLDNITVSFIDGDHISYSVDVEFSLGNLQGNQLGDGLPLSSCLLISTSYVGAAPNRGRIYFAGFPEDKQSDGVWDAATRIAMRDMVDEWSTGFNVLGTNTSLQILRRPSAVFPAYVANPVQVVGGTGSTRAQRRRNLA